MTTIKKKCGECGDEKPIGEFFCAPFDGTARGTKTSRFCKQCHSEGRIKHGYGWPGFGGMFSNPEEATA